MLVNSKGKIQADSSDGYALMKKDKTDADFALLIFF